MSEWQKVKLDDICNFVKGETGIAKADAGEYPLVVTGKERKTCDSFQLDCKAVCIPLVSSSGHGKASLNYVHYQEGKFALGSILVAVIPKDENVINAQFLHLYLSRLKDSLLVPLMKGSANVALSVSAVKDVEISLPKIEKQIEIINLFNQIDLDHQELAKENTNQQTYLTQLRQAILQEAIEGKLTADWRVKNPVQKGNLDHDAQALLETIKAEKQKLMADGKIKKEKPLAPINPDDVPFALPDGWVWVRLGGICTKIGSGSTPKGSNYALEGLPFFRSQNIYNTGLVFDDIKYISEDVHKKMNGTVVLSGDLLLNITGGSLARCARVPDEFNEGNVSQHVCIIRAANINKDLLHLLVLSPFFQKFIFSSTTGAGREGLPKYNLEQFAIPLPPLAEQNAIVERVDRLLESVNALELQVTERKSYAQQLMQAVLKEAFLG